MRTIFLLMALILGWSGAGVAQQPTVEERQIRMEEGQKALVQRIDDTNRRIDDLRTDMNKRFEDLRTDMNKRFEDMRTDMNQRFNDLMFWLQVTFGALMMIMAGLIAQWLVMWRRLIRVDVKLFDHLQETEKDRVLAIYREEVEVLKARLERLEAAGRP